MDTERGSSRRRFKLDSFLHSVLFGVAVASGVLVAFYTLFEPSVPEISMSHPLGDMTAPGQGDSLLQGTGTGTGTGTTVVQGQGSADAAGKTFGTTQQQGSGALAKTDVCNKGSCIQRTGSGFCPQQLFEAYDKAYEHYWPGSVDLLIRTCLNAESYKLQLMIRSVDLFWPKGLGDLVVVLDAGEEWGYNIFPKPWKVFYEDNYLSLPGKVLQQWSYGWADNYTTADFVSIMDDDAVFVLKVTPALLFNLTTGKPYLLALMADGLNPRSWRQHALWNASTSFHLGAGNYRGNFMTNLPWTIPRSTVPRFREFVQRANNGTPYDRVTTNWCEVAPMWKGFNLRDHMAHNIMGNYIALFERDLVDLVVENTMDVIPIPRTGLHLSYIPELVKLTTLKKRDPASFDAFTFQKGFLKEAASRMAFTICEVIPQGQMPGCNFEEQHRVLARAFWRYVEKWSDWYRIFTDPHPNGTVVLDIYRQELGCMYNAVTQGCAVNSVPVTLASLDACVRRDSTVNPGWWTSS